MIPLWIVSMDRRTLYEHRSHAERIAAFARTLFSSRAIKKYSFAVEDTGHAFVISAKRDNEPVTGFIFDGEFMRSDP